MENYYSSKSVAAVLLDGMKYEMYKMFEKHREREREMCSCLTRQDEDGC